jgi:YgiT-type zinc finger domain-containing protein
MKTTYGDCIYCGGEVEERTGRLDYRFHGQLYIVENVTMGVCRQCGEKFLTAEMVDRLHQLLSTSIGPLPTLPVPVLTA